MNDLSAFEIRRLVDQRCDEFEQCCAEGNWPKIEAFLGDAPPPARVELLAELVELDLELRARAGEYQEIEPYLEQYPEHVAVIENAFSTFESWARTTKAIDESVKSRIVFDDSETGKEALTTGGVPGEERANRLGASYATPEAEDGQLFGRYEVVRRLGQGGMGTVYLAKDPALDRLVALKLPNFQTDNAEEAIERFYREARAMATVHHPHLCPIFDVGETDGRPYLAMGYVDGHSLAEDTRMAQPESAARAAGLVRTLASALQTVHDAGVVHRDLKPSNVMIDAKGQPIITDFGLATYDQRSESQLTRSGAVLGSPAYMAPEQVRGQLDRIGPATDVYALGVMLYQLLCGRRPFDGTALSILGKIEAEIPPPRPSEFVNISPKLEAVCLRAMSYDVDDRYQSATELAESLEPFIHEPEPGEVPPVTSDLLSRKSSVFAGLLIATILGTLAALWAAGILFRVETPEGDLVVRIRDDRFAATVAGQELTITNLDTDEMYVVRLKKSESVKNLKPGKYRFELESSSGLKTTVDQFTISAGEKTQVEVSWQPRVAKAKPASKTGDGPTKPAPSRPKIVNHPPPALPITGGISQTITVNTTKDTVDGNITSAKKLIGSPGPDGMISLREAVIAANRTVAADVIVLDVDGTIQLGIKEDKAAPMTTGDLDITSSLTIRGNGARRTIIDGGGIDRVFHVATDGTAVHLLDMTIQNGAAESGGGIHIEGKNLSVTIERIRLTNNRVKENGGAVNVAGFSDAVRVMIRDCLLDNNVSKVGSGGGLTVFPVGTVSVFNTTISHNSAMAAGGVVAQLDGSGSIELVHCTITENISTYPLGSGVQRNGRIGGTMTLTNSIIVGNRGDQFVGEDGGVVHSGGNNLIGPGNAAFRAVESDRVVTAPPSKLLRPLSDNGGPTNTHALVRGSIAIDAGSNAAAERAGLRSDQRGAGFDRAIQGKVDVGAFESGTR